VLGDGVCVPLDLDRRKLRAIKKPQSAWCNPRLGQSVCLEQFFDADCIVCGELVEVAIDFLQEFDSYEGEQ